MPDTPDAEIRCTPASALTGERVQFSFWTEDPKPQALEGVVVASRPAGRNFVDVLLDDGRMVHSVHNYTRLTVLPAAPSSPRQEG